MFQNPSSLWVPPLPFYMPRGRGRIHERERERERSSGSSFSSSLRVVPTGPVDDDGDIPAPLLGATYDMHLDRTGGTPPGVFGGRRVLTRQDRQHEPPVHFTASPLVRRTTGACGNGLSSPGVMSEHVFTCPRARGLTPRHDLSFRETPRAPRPCSGYGRIRSLGVGLGRARTLGVRRGGASPTRVGRGRARILRVG
jgi:hypothetical protein